MYFVHAHWSGTRFNWHAHTARRQSLSMAVLPENNEDLTAFGYDYVRMLSAKKPRFTGTIFKLFFIKIYAKYLFFYCSKQKLFRTNKIRMSEYTKMWGNRGRILMAQLYYHLQEDKPTKIPSLFKSRDLNRANLTFVFKDCFWIRSAKIVALGTMLSTHRTQINFML